MHLPRPRLETLLCILAMVLGLAAAASAEPAGELVARRLSTRIDFERVDEPLLGLAVLVATNERRVEHGLAPLRQHPRLIRMAARHARRMAEHDFYSHEDPIESTGPEERAAASGIANPMVAENIHDYRALRSDGGAVYPLSGRGRFSVEPDGAAIPAHTYWSFAEAIVDEWMASPGHRANILSRDARQLGVGVSFYWRDGGWPFVKAVQNFQFFEDVAGR
jgi:uncharacterized protein YkwD